MQDLKMQDVQKRLAELELKAREMGLASELQEMRDPTPTNSQKGLKVNPGVVTNREKMIKEKRF